MHTGMRQEYVPGRPLLQAKYQEGLQDYRVPNSDHEHNQTSDRITTDQVLIIEERKWSILNNGCYLPGFFIN